MKERFKIHAFGKNINELGPSHFSLCKIQKRLGKSLSSKSMPKGKHKNDYKTR